MFDHLGVLNLEKMTEEIVASLDEAELPTSVVAVSEKIDGIEFWLRMSAGLAFVEADEEDQTRLDGYVLLRLTKGVRWTHLLGRVLMASDLGAPFSGAYDANLSLLASVYTVTHDQGVPMERIQLAFTALDSLGRTEGVVIQSVANRVYVVTHRRYEEWVRQLFAKDLRPENENRVVPGIQGEPLN